MYFFLAVGVAVFFSYLAQKYKKFFFVVLIMIILSLLAGFRDYSVGTDTLHYHNIFINYYNGGGEYFSEKPFMYIVKLLMMIFKGDRIVFVFYSFVINILILSMLWRMRHFCNFTLMCFFYIVNYYPQSMNIIRQYVALAVVFFSFQFLIKKRYLSYLIIVVLVSFMFHRSAIVAIPLGIIWYYLNSKNSKKILCLFLLTVVISPFMIMPLKSIFYEYREYFLNPQFKMSILFPIEVAMMIVYMIIYARRKTYIESGEERLYDAFFIINSIISFGFTFLGFYYENMGRIGLYYSIYRIPCETRMSMNNKYSNVYKLAYIGLGLFNLVYKVAYRGETGVLPFSF